MHIVPAATATLIAFLLHDNKDGMHSRSRCPTLSSTRSVMCVLHRSSRYSIVPTSIAAEVMTWRLALHDEAAEATELNAGRTGVCMLAFPT